MELQSALLPHRMVKQH